MEKISRRTLVAATASLVTLLQSLIPWNKKGVQAFEYTAPVTTPYSKTREEMNQLILRAEKREGLAISLSDCGACSEQSEESPGLLRLHLATVALLAMTR